MTEPLHLVVRCAERSVVDALDDLRSEIALAKTPQDAIRLYDVLHRLDIEVDRLELLALERANTLCGGCDVRS